MSRLRDLSVNDWTKSTSETDADRTLNYYLISGPDSESPDIMNQFTVPHSVLILVTGFQVNFDQTETPGASPI